jgi:hypothetical protein
VITAGANGETLVADASTSTGLRYQGSMAGGKNAIINGGFDIWQRGTSFTNPGTGQTFTTDRWSAYMGNGTVTQDTSLVNANSRFGLRVTATASSNYSLLTIIETLNALPLAGKTVTLSGYYAGTLGINPAVALNYSTTVDDSLFNINTGATVVSSSLPTVTGSFQRFSVTYSLSSTAKTLRVSIDLLSMVNTNFVTLSDIQLELGSVATTFTRAGGTIQGELAACQRYYWRFTVPTGYANLAPSAGIAASTTVARFAFLPPVPMRTTPTSLDYSTLILYDTSATPAVTSAAHSAYTTASVMGIDFTVASGLTQYRPYQLLSSNSTSAYLGASAEL